MSHRCANTLVVRYLLRHKVPERFSMIELLEMAELVYDEVVLGLGWQSYDLPIEVEVAIARTAPPPCALIFDKDFVV